VVSPGAVFTLFRTRYVGATRPVTELRSDSVAFSLSPTRTTQYKDKTIISSGTKAEGKASCA